MLEKGAEGEGGVEGEGEGEGGGQPVRRKKGQTVRVRGGGGEEWCLMLS